MSSIDHLEITVDRLQALVTKIKRYVKFSESGGFSAIHTKGINSVRGNFQDNRGMRIGVIIVMKAI